MPLAAPILCSLLAAFHVASGTVGERFDAETRVRGINLSLESAPGLDDEPSPGTHRGIGYTYGETASDRANQYNGRVYDPGTGFHDYGARMYWPQIGRFISPDTAGPDPSNPATFNRYAYVHNNPYKWIDPTGHAIAAPAVVAAFRADEARLASARATLSNPNASFLEKLAATGKAALAAFNLASGEGIVPMPAIIAARGAAAEATASGATRVLFHGTDAASAESIVAKGVNLERAAEMGGGDLFWATTEREAAQWFAKANPAGGAPAVVRMSVPEKVMSSLVKSGGVEVEGAVHAFSADACRVLNDTAAFTLIK